MLSVSLVFLFFAGIAFLGFIINALFYKFKISSVLPLMIIGLIVGPVLNLVNTQPGSFISLMTPYIAAIAIAFILFDVGINMKVGKLSEVFAVATKFTFLLAILTAVVASLVAYYTLGWTLIEAFIFGFAIAGPSSLIVPTVMRLLNIRPELKTALLYESVSTDVLQLIVPLTLIAFIINPLTSTNQVVDYVLSVVFGSIALAIVSAVFWLYLLNRYQEQSRAYSWMLTVAMIIASYAIAEWLNISGAITVFVFGLAFANIGGMKKLLKKSVLRMFAVGSDIKHIRNYQREIVFFTSAFFFVYIGLLFQMNDLNLMLVLISLVVVAVILALRYLLSTMLKPYFSQDKALKGVDRKLVYYNIPRGLSSAIVATVPLTLGISIPGFLDVVFLVILFTNIVSTFGMVLSYRKLGGVAKIKPNGT